MNSSVGPVPHVVFDLLPLLILVLFPFSIWQIAKFGGWSRLAEVYRTDKPFEGFLLKGRWGRFAYGMSYKGILNLGTNPEGFYLSINKLFSFGHPPLFIPWRDIQAHEDRAFFMKIVVLEFAQVPGLRVSLKLSDVLQLQENGAPFKIPSDL